MTIVEPDKVISTILKHDAKGISYKIALLRAINDIALSFPNLANSNRNITIPLRMLSEFWIAYYWLFVSASNPIIQGQRAKRGEKQSNDMAFRPHLALLRSLWEEEIRTVSRPLDGFFLIDEMRVPRKRILYSSKLLGAYKQTLDSISRTMIEGPICHAGPGNWSLILTLL